MMSGTNVGVILLLALITIWLLGRPGEGRDRAFLVIAGAIYIAVMFVTFWKFGMEQKGRLMASLLAETAAFVLVKFSKKIKRNSE